ncbi:MAG TPA: hypothetical protein VGJ03_13710 [Acidimicrobiales bacterium]|jgi:hypothetical protein
MPDRRLPEWLSFDKNLGVHDRVDRLMRWFREGAARETEVPSVAARDRLTEQLEHLRDAVDAARSAGLEWSEIARCLGFSPHQVRKTFAT